MATITVLDSTGATQTIAKVTATGSAADADSLPVAQSTEAKALTGALTETAPGTDTASSGLNGRLQRIAQRITSLIALLPASLGSKSVAASLATSAKSGGTEYETVAASQTGQVLGATGATGDYIEGVLCVVSTAATSQVTLIDNATSIVILPNNVGAGVGSYYVPLGLTSVSGAWSITTAAGVAVVASGDFT